MRGALAVLIAKLVFMVAGYVLVAGLTRLLTKEQFGDYGVVFGVASLVNMVVVQGTMQSVSRAVANNAAAAGSLWRQAMRVQLILVALLVGAVFITAPLIAHLLQDDGLTTPLRVILGVTALYGIYAVNVGTLNGRKLLTRQAGLDMTFSVLRVTCILVAAGLGLGVVGVAGGFVLAAGIILLASFVVLGRPQADGATAQALAPAAFLKESLTLMGTALILNALLQGDLFVLKSVSAPDVSDAQAGLYTAAQQIARIPYYLMAAAAIVVFPAVASLSSTDDHQRRGTLVSQAFTGVLGLVIGMAAVTAPVGDRIMAVLYPDSYAPAAPAFSLVVTGLVLLTAANIGGNMLAAAGRARLAFLMLVVALVVQASVAFVLVPRWGLTGAGTATLAAGMLALWMNGAALRALGARISARAILVPTLAAILSGAFVFLAGEALPAHGAIGKLVTVALVSVGYGGYLLVLLLGGTLFGVKGARSRVLLVTKPLEPPFNDGAKVLARALAERLPADDIAILCTRQGCAHAPPGVETRAVYGGTSSFVPRSLENVRVLLFLLSARYDYKALHFFFAPNKVTNLAVRVLRALSPGLPVVQTVMSRPRSYDEGRALVFGDVVVAHSEDTAEQLKAASGHDTLVIRPGIVLPSRDALASERTTARTALGLANDHYALLFAGDIEEGGALQHLETIVPEVLSQHPRAVFLFSVRTKHGARTRVAAEAFVTRALQPLAGRTQVFFDHQPFTQLLAAADAMVLPAENTLAKVDAPLVALEQMARGVPVFLLARAPLSEIPPPALASLLLADDAPALADKILAHARGLGLSPDTLIDHVQHHFSIDSAAKRYQEIHARL